MSEKKRLPFAGYLSSSRLEVMDAREKGARERDTRGRGSVYPRGLLKSFPAPYLASVTGYKTALA